MLYFFKYCNHIIFKTARGYYVFVLYGDLVKILI